jgi:DNA invertase Pin-like site-specific DNA recombinase
MTESEPQNRRLGYARVSTYGQTLDAQTAQLRAEGCAKIYREKASGAQADRRELLKLLKERDLIRTRTAEGRSRAKARGQHMGRPPALTAQQQAKARKRRSEGTTLKELAQSYNVGIATISRLSSGVAG